ncbi:HGGxSTG domain-containing protein [Acidithiobacillus ferridurans]|uniref:HGGxSTG domain-containing protein n=1 Tax=Acidithiobacillus ferridurans TaxID=1232575 RepID=UPI001C071085|nr:HGGxSTG domain-containing protein [Acidithiobacillus ferridurans]MBU2732856.1 hypothetical protein [Acidithiobacillus ferridurans]
MKPTYCGAKTRSGTPCRRHPIAGRKRCRLHGGTNPGPGYGNQNAKVHGIYCRNLSEAEKADAAQVEIGNIDILIRLAHLQLKHLLKVRQSAPELDEVVTYGSGQRIVKRTVDYDAKIDRAMRLIAKLEKIRHQGNM